jgi:hypothetical protein
VGSRDDNLYAVYPDGTQKWAAPAGYMVFSSPSIAADGTIYVGSMDGNLYAVPPAVPAAPPRLAATAANAQVVLSWAAPIVDATDGLAASYNVYRGATSGGEAASRIATNVTGTTYTDTGLTDGTTYYYYVRAVNLPGMSPDSNEASAMPLDPPAQPTSLTATSGISQVTLAWSAPSTDSTDGPAASYSIYRGAASGGESASPIITGVTGTTYTNTGLTNGTTYYYYVSAVNAGGIGPDSNEVNATPYAPLLAPTNVRAAPGSGQATLTWSPVSGAGWYTVKFSKTSGGPYSTGIAKVVGTTATVSMLSDGVTYYFVVSAGNRFTTGPNSSQVSAMPHSG